LGVKSQVVRPALCAVLAASVASCATTQTIPGEANSFQGIASLGGGFEKPGNTISSGATPLRILIIHGMGTASEGGFDDFMLEVAGKFRLVQISQPRETLNPPCGEESSAPGRGLTRPQPQLVEILGVPAPDQARLYTYYFSGLSNGSSPSLAISYLMWSPLTCRIKASPQLEEEGHPKRQLATDFAKEFIRDKFGDVVLYDGAYRQKILRPAIEKALCLFIGGQPVNAEFTGGRLQPRGQNCQGGDETTATVIVTHSLGSYMLMDAINDELARARAGDGSGTAASRLIGATQFIFMMANQIPLLDLSGILDYPIGVDQPDGAVASGAERATTMNDFTGNLRALGTKGSLPLSNGGAYYDRQVIAFSDPNDILSYLVKRQALGLPGADRELFLTNVYLRNGEFSVPLLLSDPVKAHIGYFTNREVLDLIVCGMNNGAVKKPCPVGGLNSIQ
jgi:hypothetical protein